MDRRGFLRQGGALAFSWSFTRHFVPTTMWAAQVGAAPENPNWADPKLGATVSASSWVENPPWGFVPGHMLTDVLQAGWETDKETTGAWLELNLGEARPVGELWILAKPLPYDLVLDPYMRGGLMATPRKIAYSLSGGAPRSAELRRRDYFQIIRLPQEERASSIRFQIQDVWPEAGTRGTGLGKVRVFPKPHAPAFEITVYPNYGVRDGKAVQAATLGIINPGKEISDARLQVSHQGTVLATVPLKVIPGQSASAQDVWVPAPFEDVTMEFALLSRAAPFEPPVPLQVPAYRSYFDGGTFNFLCTNHNDLGWLDTQQVTADYRSAELILPAMELMKQYPEFRYSMESVGYLIEFLERHPERREEMAQLMREGRFAWGASYVQCLEAHVGPEKLVRQFYLGRRWLMKNFPGVDTRYYVKTDPPAMTLQMPQILAKAGIEYVIQARFPWGFYRWVAPDGSRVFMFCCRYADPRGLLNPKSNRGWLSYATLREPYYEARQLPPIFIYDFNGDYLPPPAPLLPFVREQNAAMEQFAAKWNEHYAGQPHRQIKPARLRFVEPKAILNDVTQHDLNVETVKGDWPLSWAYYDEPSNRDGLLAGREGHNRLLAAERFHAGLEEWDPDDAKTFADAWRANCWPDHGWGGNRGIITDANYVASYQKSKELADKLLQGVGARVARRVPKGSDRQVPLVVFNPLSWRRTDVVQCEFGLPSGWDSFVLRDDKGKEIPIQTVSRSSNGRSVGSVFIAEDVPSVGYRTYYLEPSSIASSEKPIAGDTMENEYLKVVLGNGGLKSLYDKRLKQEVLRTEKLSGGEVLQFTAPGLAWEDAEIVTLDDFDRTSNHEFTVKNFAEGPVRASALKEAKFKHFVLREQFHLYRQLARVDIDLEVKDWDGQKDRELRVAFPINLDKARLSYEVPFGTVEIGKDEVDFSLLPPSPDTQWRPDIYGGDKPLRYREAINWVDASQRGFQGFGCLTASDMTVHLFEDETRDPVSYPVLQHVLLSTRKSLAWNPEYWFTQKGTHRYRMALFPHRGNWRLRYREAIEFNYPLVAFIAPQGSEGGGSAVPSSAEWLRLEPKNLILTAMKKSEDDDRVVLRFYEAEGRAVRGRIKLSRPVKRAWRTSLIEEDQDPLPVAADGSLQIAVNPWEIVTIKLAA